MQMAMYVDTESFCHTIRMQRDMAQDELIHEHSNTMDLLEANAIVSIVSEDVVVATNKDLTTVHPLHQLEILLVDYNITQEVDSVLLLDLSVVTLDHSLVHFLVRGERTERTTISQLELFPRVRMTKVMVRDHEPVYESSHYKIPFLQY